MAGRYEASAPAGGAWLGSGSDCRAAAMGRKAEKRVGGGGERLGEAEDVEEVAGVGDNVMLVLGARAADFRA